MSVLGCGATARLIRMLVLALGLLLAGSARADELTDFEAARSRYERHDYARAVDAFRKLVGTDPPRITSPLLVIESRKYYAASLLFMGAKEEARSQFRQLLTQEPEYALDPLAFPTEVVALFDEVKGDVRRDPDRAAVILRALREAGAALALDDFGTGFSSLTWLAKLPFDTLKIDRYFVLTMDKDEGSAKIVKSVVNLGRDLSLEVVAEGVENAGLASLLLDAQMNPGKAAAVAAGLAAALGAVLAGARASTSRRGRGRPW